MNSLGYAPMSNKLVLSVGIVEEAHVDLLNIFVMVCDANGQLVTRLGSNGFVCSTPQHTDQNWTLEGLPHQAFEEMEPGCYRIAVRCEPSQPPIDCITLTVRQWSRSLPVGTAPTYSPTAEGHVLVELARSPFDETARHSKALWQQRRI